MHAVERGRSFSPRNNVDDLAVKKGTIEDQWKNHPEELFKFDNLKNLVEQNEIARLDQDGAFIVFTHPERRRDTTEPVHSHGWKFHISVRPEDHHSAFDLAAPIISRYCSCFKVTDPEKVLKSSRFSEGAQITICLEGKGEWGVKPEVAEKMMQEIEQVFLNNKIRVGQKPASDAETVSPFFSMRNDALNMPGWDKATYITAETIGDNYNPANHPNPFGHLLSSGIPAFDPLKHFQSLAHVDWDLGIEFLYALTLFSYVREYTDFDLMDKQAQQEFIFKFCAETGGKFDTTFLKEAYRENPDIILAVKQALSIVLISEAGDSLLKSEFHWHIISSQFSTQPTVDKSFNELMQIIEDYSKERDAIYQFQYHRKLNLIDVAQTYANKMVASLSAQELISIIKEGHFYYAEASVNRLRRECEDDQYKKILHENESIPAVQLALAKIYQKSDGLEKSSGYYLEALLSTDANFIKLDIDTYLKNPILDQLLKFHQPDNHPATYLLALISMRDILTDLPFEKFTNVPISYDFSRECLNKIQQNPLYREDAAKLTTLL